ncbi:MAG: carboxylating nicotinate-nucleotide diphosphorylase [Verrucomicrobia bacterium]|nr:carboxylating nicotinate-nucleotide diphosphorylase [Verrucomicrobiota bacterium]
MNSPEKDAADALIKAALLEDLGDRGDVTTRHFVPPDALGRARLFAKQPDTVLSGLEIARRVFERVDPSLRVHLSAADGDSPSPGATVLEVGGRLASILTAERTALNFVQHLSGVATLTRRFVHAVQGTSCRILDTRKTTPGWRLLEKAAVAHGGGTNHRNGLYDGVMVKDNHLVAEHRLPALRAGIDRVRSAHPGMKIELEVDTLEQLDAFLTLDGVDVILLDNMSLEQLREAVRRRNATKPSVQLEASGGVRLDTVRGIAETGVDFVSVGALTHSAPAVDVSLEIRSEDPS